MDLKLDEVSRFVQQVQAERSLLSDEFTITFDEGPLGLGLVQPDRLGFPVVPVSSIKNDDMAKASPTCARERFSRAWASRKWTAGRSLAWQGSSSRHRGRSCCASVTPRATSRYPNTPPPPHPHPRPHKPSPS